MRKRRRRELARPQENKSPPPRPPEQDRAAEADRTAAGGEATLAAPELLQLHGARTSPSALLKVQGAIRTTSNGTVAVEPMVDSGASGMGFIDPRCAERCGAKMQPSQRRIALADGTVVLAAGEVTIDYTLAPKSGPPIQFRSTFIVTPLEPYDLILGIGWLERHKVLVAFHERSMQLRVDGLGEQRAIRPVARVTDDGTTALAPLRLTTLTERGFQRAMRQGKIGSVHAIFVRAVKEDGTTADIPLSEVPGLKDNPRMMRLVQEFERSVFPKMPPPGVPPKRGVEHAIELKPGARPPPARALRHQSARDAEILHEHVKAGLAAGQLQASTSPYGSMALVVLKKDGTPRVVVDYRALNEITIKNKYPLPLMDELFDRVAGAKWFTKIDLKSGFHQIAIRPEDREKTAFRTRDGSFEYTVLPMGLCNAPGTFMQMMNETFRDMLDKSVLCFLDDILIYSQTEEEHVRQVRAVLERLRANKLYGKLSKCSFMQREVEFLGHHIGADGLRMSPDKVGAVKSWPQPTSTTEVRSFLGLANFYRRFVEGYSRIALPLTELTKDATPFTWGEPQQKAFDALKATLCSAPVLVIPDQSKPFALSCDACKFSIGAVLQQDHGRGLQPVAYFSAKLSDAERNYDVREREFMAIFRACLHWRPYLHGSHPFRLLSDHKSLLYYMTMPNLTDRLARWVERMQEFNCGIEYIKGEENVVADALSRRADHSVNAVTAAARRRVPAANEAAEQRQRNIDAATKVIPRDPALPPPQRNGTIATPSQRCSASTAKGPQCQQRTAVGHVCWNHLQRDFGLRVKKSSIPSAGRGLFAAWQAGLPKGHRIPYTGDEIDLPTGSAGGPYVLQLKRGSGVDATRRNCGVGRWVNDPRGAMDEHGRPRTANCEFVVHTPRGGERKRIGAVRTLRPVEKGEELLVKYGDSYWRYVAGGQTQVKQRRCAPKDYVIEHEFSPPAPIKARKTVSRTSVLNAAAVEKTVTWAEPLAAVASAHEQAMTAKHRRHPSRIIEETAQAYLTAMRLTPMTADTKPPDFEPLVAAARRAAQRDAKYAKWLEEPPAGLTVDGGLLFDEQNRMRVPHDLVLRTRLLAEMHDGVTGAHAGRDRMLESMHKRFQWDGMATDVERYVTTCDACQRNKHSKQLTPGLLMPLPIVEEPFAHLTTDGVTGLPRTKRGKDAMQVYMCRASKTVILAATRKSDGAAELADVTMDKVIGPYGMPKSIVSDRDPRLTARFAQELRRVLGDLANMSTARHAQTDGLSEREIQTLTTVLRSYVNELSNDWDTYLPALQLALNSKVQASTGVSPYYLVYGREPRLPIDCALEEARSAPTLPAVIDRAQRIKRAMAAAYSKKEQAQARQKAAADRHRRLMRLSPGDQVMMSTEGLQLRSGTHKLTARFIGPFTVKGLVNDNAVTLDLPPLLGALHPTINISRLKLYRDGQSHFPTRPQRHVQPPAVSRDTNGDAEYAVECIVAQRGSARNKQLLVRWDGYGAEHDEWKPRRELLQSAPKKVAEFDARQRDAVVSQLAHSDDAEYLVPGGAAARLKMTGRIAMSNRLEWDESYIPTESEHSDASE